MSIVNAHPKNYPRYIFITYVRTTIYSQKLLKVDGSKIWNEHTLKIKTETSVFVVLKSPKCYSLST